MDALSNYYEILGVWRDASSGEIEQAAQTANRRYQDALAFGDPHAEEWLQIVKQARETLLEPEARRVDEDSVFRRGLRRVHL